MNSPISFKGVYETLFEVFGWIENFFEIVRQPIREWIEVDLGVIGDNVVLGWLEEALNWLLDLFLGTRFADMSLLSFCFGSGITLVLALSLARFLFMKIR